MKRYNFNDESEFLKLERMAYDNVLDYTDFPPAEYKYFDKLSKKKKKHQNGQLPKGIKKERK